MNRIEGVKRLSVAIQRVCDGYARDEQERRSNGQFGSGGATTPPKAAGGGEAKPKLGGLKGELTSMKKMAEHWKGVAANSSHPDHAKAKEHVAKHEKAIKQMESALKDPEVAKYSMATNSVTLKNGQTHKVTERY